MKKRTVITIIVIVVALIAAGALFVNNQQKNAAAMFEDLEVEAAKAGDLTDIIGGTGTVRSKQSAYLVWQTSGIVEIINTEESDLIEKDFELASLDASSLSQAIISSQAELINLQQNLEDLYDNAELNKAQAELDVIQTQEILDDLEEDRVWLDYPRCNQDTIDDYWDEYQDSADKVVDMEGKYDGSSTMRDQINESKNVRDVARANWEYCSHPREQNEIDEADLEIAQARANLQLAQQKLDILTTNNPDPDEVASLEARIKATHATLDAMIIDAPFAGTVTMVDIQIGDQVSAGTTAFRLDDLSELLVDVQISEVDINKIEIGQEVLLSFDSALGVEYIGEVSKIASVGTEVQGVVEFTVTVKLVDLDEKIKPGMSATVNIAVSEYENALLVPNSAIRFKDGQRVVYIQNTNGAVPEAVPVTLGITSNDYSQVLDGDLKAGDKIVLNPPEEIDMEAMRGNNRQVIRGAH